MLFKVYSCVNLYILSRIVSTRTSITVQNFRSKILFETFFHIALSTKADIFTFYRKGITHRLILVKRYTLNTLSYRVEMSLYIGSGMSELTASRAGISLSTDNVPLIDGQNTCRCVHRRSSQSTSRSRTLATREFVRAALFRLLFNVIC